MFFRKSKKVDTSMRSMDKLVTGLIIGGAVASIVGLSKTKKGNEITKVVSNQAITVTQKGISVLGKGLVKVIGLFSKK